MSDDYDETDDECPNCGGKGFIFVCEDEVACIDPRGRLRSLHEAL